MTTASSNDVAALPYTQQRFLFMSLDPVHIGAGGYRLGRVDMSITREPGTNLPKIPGTSLAGATRSYAAMRYGKPAAAGQHKDLGREQRVKCPIIYTFGTATDTSSGQPQAEGVYQAGTVNIMDAHVLFFPVNSLAGPVWVSTKGIIEEAWGPGSVELPAGMEQDKDDLSDDVVATSLLNGNTELNLGWLLFPCRNGLQIKPPDKLKTVPGEPTSVEEGKFMPAWAAIEKRIALVNSRLFSHIVNSNLEVRTSVSIKPETGAAEPGALFTYEAIPRATWLWCDVIEDDYKKKDDIFPVQHQYNSETKEEKMGKHFPRGEQWNGPLDVVSAGMRLIEHLGIGGMGTRGFGRMLLVGKWEIDGEANSEKS